MPPRAKARTRPSEQPPAEQPPSEKPLLLSGPPDTLRATLSLGNSTDGRLPVRGAVLRRAGSSDVRAPLSVILAPGAGARVPITISLPADTAPAEFEAELEVGGVQRPVLVRVEAALRMDISPAQVLAPTGRSPVSFMATSRANVDLPIAAVMRAVTRTGRDDDGPDVTLTLTSPAVLTPGARLEMHGQLDVPRSLDPTRRHVAVLPVGLADLTVIVLPHAAD